MRDQREEQDRWRREDEERRRQGEGRMRYDYGSQSDRRGGRQEERGSFREEGHSRWQGGAWQGEYPGRDEQRRSSGSERGEYRSISREDYLDREDRGSERYREQGSGWSGMSERERPELRGGRQEQGRWGIGSERSGEGRMSWEDRGGDRSRSTDSGEYRGSDYRSREESGRLGVHGRDLESGSRGGSQGYRGEWERGEYRSDRDRDRSERSREDGSRRGESGRDISGTWRQFDSWGDTEYGDSRGQGLGHHRRDSYSSDFWSQGERGRDHDR